jgi:hypothetical protein
VPIHIYIYIYILSLENGRVEWSWVRGEFSLPFRSLFLFSWVGWDDLDVVFYGGGCSRWHNSFFLCVCVPNSTLIALLLLRIFLRSVFFLLGRIASRREDAFNGGKETIICEMDSAKAFILSPDEGENWGAIFVCFPFLEDGFGSRDSRLSTFHSVERRGWEERRDS